MMNIEGNYALEKVFYYNEAHPEDADEIMDNIVWYLEAWTKKLNFNFYSEEYCSATLVSDYLRMENNEKESIIPEDYIIQRNAFFLRESKSIGKDIIELRNLLSKYHFKKDETVYVRQFLKYFESTKEGKDAVKFLSELKSRTDYENFWFIIENKIEFASLLEIMYYCTIIYLDLCKIHEFLISKVDLSLPVAPESQKIEVPSDVKIGTLVQSVLYHCVLIKAGLEPYINHRETECLELATRYGFRGWKRFSDCFTNIYVKPKSNTYRYSDVKIVERALKENHPLNPRLLSKLQELTGKIYP